MCLDWIHTGKQPDNEKKAFCHFLSIFSSTQYLLYITGNSKTVSKCKSLGEIKKLALNTWTKRNNQPQEKDDKIHRCKHLHLHSLTALGDK